MQRITPTEWAEEAYQAGLAKPMAMGSAGIMIPQARSIYRKTIDGPLLTQIQKAAFAAHARQRLPRAAHEVAAAALRDDLLERYPPSDAAVLERHGFARPIETLIVVLNTPSFDRPWYARLAEPVVIPEAAARFQADLGGRLPTKDANVPDAVMPFLRTMVELGRDRVDLFEAATRWVGRRRTEAGRHPFWHEIEREFPLIGEWLASQRAQIKTGSAA